MADKKASAANATQPKGDKKEKKADGKKKVPFTQKVKSWFAGVVKYFKDVKSEMKKVVWPSKKDTKNNTIVVIVVVAVAAVCMLVLDVVFGGAIHLMIGA